MQRITDKVQVNIPFTMLFESYIDRFIKYRLNPEIGIDAAALDRFSISDFNAIAQQLHKHNLNITLHGPFMDLSPGSQDPVVRKVTRYRFAQLLNLVSVFKPKTVVCHLGYERKRYCYCREIWIKNSLEIWAWLGSRIKDEGSRLMLENVYEDGPEDMEIFFKHLVHYNVGFCLDTGHQAAFGNVPLEAWLDSLGLYLGQIHLHDNDGRYDDHLALGHGNINFRPLFYHLKTRKKPLLAITLEPHKEEDLWPSLEYLEKAWAW